MLHLAIRVALVHLEDPDGLDLRDRILERVPVDRQTRVALEELADPEGGGPGVTRRGSRTDRLDEVDKRLARRLSETIPVVRMRQAIDQQKHVVALLGDAEKDRPATQGH